MPTSMRRPWFCVRVGRKRGEEEEGREGRRDEREEVGARQAGKGRD